MHAFLQNFKVLKNLIQERDCTILLLCKSSQGKTHVEGAVLGGWKSWYLHEQSWFLAT